jgi:hypothetical protein
MAGAVDEQAFVCSPLETDKNCPSAVFVAFFLESRLAIAAKTLHSPAPFSRREHIYPIFPCP